MSDPIENAKGMAVATSPAINAGGWKNMPKWVSSGLIPWPSGGITASLSKGLAMNPMTARKKANMTIKIAVVYGIVSSRRWGALQMARADITARAKAMNSREPSLPA